tara:strand:- start:173 stop:367 length:195 start_codon:yes stop_codon:yes gene_type:complete
MLDGGNDKDDQYRGESPTNDERQEWKLEDIKTDIDTKLLVDDSEVNSVREEQPALPLRRNSSSD